jgi:hypothetical protein
MPYRREWIENERAFSFLGIPVYHAYKDDDVENQLECWFHICEDGENGEAFDARDLLREDPDLSASLVVGVEDMPEGSISSLHRRIAYALWTGRLIPPCYSEQFVLAKIQDVLGGDGGSGVTKETLGFRLLELLNEYNVAPETGRCEVLDGEDIGLRDAKD